MTIKKTSILKIFITFLIIFNFLALSNSFKVNADGINDLDVDSYTNSDEFEFESKIYNINQYSNSLYNERGNFILKGPLHIPEWTDKNDDPIVKIIPKQLFCEEIEYTYIGQEYGFFIKTEKKEISSNNGKLYNSIVLVFDIETQTPTKTSQIIVTIKPIFQYEYICMTGQGWFKINDITFGFEGLNEPWVIAKPKEIDKYTFDVIYGPSDKYSLKDISFNASLANEQNSNAFDDSYNPYEDYGYFFTGFDYGFYGHTIEHVDDEESYYNFFANNITCIIGFFDIPVLSQINNIFSATLTRKDDYLFLKNSNPILGIKLEIKEKQIETVEFPQNRNDQIEKTRKEFNKERLIKKVILKPSDKDSDIYYSVGEYFVAKFNVNHSALNNRKTEYTRFNNDLYVKIVDSKTKEEISIGTGRIINFFGEEEVNDLELYKNKNIYLMPNGENTFVFTPKHAGIYSINIVNDEKVSVNIDDENFEGADIEVKKYLAKSITITIKLDKCSNRSTGRICVVLSGNQDKIELEANGELLFSLKSLSGIKLLTTNNANVLIKRIYYLNEKNELVDISEYSEDYIVTYIFNGNQQYAILIKNQLSNTQNSMFEIKEIDSLNEGLNSDIDIYRNYTFYEIDYLSRGQYVIILSNIMNYEYKCKMYNYKFELLTEPLSYHNGEYLLSIDDGAYYIGFTSGDYCKTDIIIKKAEETFEWEIKGNDFYLRTNERDVDLKRGYKYHFDFLINGNVIETDMSINIDKNVKYE